MVFASFLVKQGSYADQGNSVSASLDTEEGKINFLKRSETSDLDKLFGLQKDAEGKPFVCLAGPRIWHNLHNCK